MDTAYGLSLVYFLQPFQSFGNEIEIGLDVHLGIKSFIFFPLFLEKCIYQTIHWLFSKMKERKCTNQLKMRVAVFKFYHFFNEINIP